MILVVGTPDSGKSAFAEQMAEEYSGAGQMAYIATMIPYGEEGQRRIEKHKRLRAGKAFVTLEEPFCVSSLLAELQERRLEVALLECVSNLVGNVIHKKENVDKTDGKLVTEIVQDISELSQKLKQFVVVANYFAMQEAYDQDTIRYVKINNEVNDQLKKLAEMVAVKENGEWVIYENH